MKLNLEEAKIRIKELAEEEKQYYDTSGCEYYLGLFQGLHDALAILKDVQCSS